MGRVAVHGVGIGLQAEDVERLGLSKFVRIGYGCGMRTLSICLICAAASPAFASCVLPETYQEVSVNVLADCESEAMACKWQFELGETESRALFRDLVTKIDGCAVPLSKMQDKGVNHPDFYDAWIFAFPDGGLSVSLKDKAALRQTFVVLRRLSSP